MVLMSNDKEKIILCITEGKKTEVNILNSLLRNYSIKKNIKIFHFGASIHELYKVLANDSDLDTFGILKEKISSKKEDFIYKRKQILAIYLFFDFEAHAKQAKTNHDIYHKMLQLFDNETENGKLIFSYPMVESYKHPCDFQPIVPIIIEGGYKKWVANICDKKLDNLKKLTLEDWNTILIQHLININDFIFDNNQLPTNYSEDDFTQDRIYQNQLDKHITTNQQVRIISPFCLFLLDFLGNSLLQQWQKINHSD